MQELYICGLAEPTNFSSPSFGAINEATLFGVLSEPSCRENKIMLAIGNESGSGYFDKTDGKTFVVTYKFVDKVEVEKRVINAHKEFLKELSSGLQQLSNSHGEFIVSCPPEMNLEDVCDFELLKERIEQHNLVVNDEFKLLKIKYTKEINRILDDIGYHMKADTIFRPSYANSKEASQEDNLTLFIFLQKHVKLLENEAFSPESRQAMRVFYDDLAKSTRA